MMTLFEATRKGLIERKQIPGRRARLKSDAVYWIVIRSDAPEEAIQQAGLPFDDAAQSWITASEQHRIFRVKGDWVYADFAVYSSDDDDEPDYVRVAIGQNVLLTIGAERTGILGEIDDEIRDVISDEPLGMPHLLFNVTNALISAHAEWAAGIRKQVDRLAKRVDTDTRSVEVNEIPKGKEPRCSTLACSGGAIHHPGIRAKGEVAPRVPGRQGGVLHP
ncbi:MAG: CorA family divalent cation transporter [Bacteroidota bacterium]